MNKLDSEHCACAPVVPIYYEYMRCLEYYQLLIALTSWNKALLSSPLQYKDSCRSLVQWEKQLQGQQRRMRRRVSGSNLRVVRFEDEHAVWGHIFDRLSLLCLLLLWLTGFRIFTVDWRIQGEEKMKWRKLMGDEGEHAQIQPKTHKLSVH